MGCGGGSVEGNEEPSESENTTSEETAVGDGAETVEEPPVEVT